jgi:RNA polymerase sigma-70 factor (ECF subfamily)
MGIESDSELLKRFENGEKEAFTELIIRHQKSIYSLAYRLIGDEREAGDIAQKVFTNAYSGISKFRRKSEFKTWLFRITINLCKNYFRSNPEKREVQLEGLPLSQAETPLTLLLEEERKVRLKAMLDRLPEKQKATLILKIYHELSYKEIARVINCAEGTVKANIFHALNNLRSMLKEEDEEGGV